MTDQIYQRPEGYPDWVLDENSECWRHMDIRGEYLPETEDNDIISRYVAAFHRKQELEPIVLTAHTPLPRDIVPKEEFWYAGRKIQFFCEKANLADQIVEAAFELLYEGKLGDTYVTAFKSQLIVLITISE
jgi:hypothetical protein